MSLGSFRAPSGRSIPTQVDPAYVDERPHPLGLVDNPEWQATLARREELYLAERERRADPEREPTGVGVAGAVIGALAVAMSLCGYLFGALFG